MKTYIQASIATILDLGKTPNRNLCHQIDQGRMPYVSMLHAYMPFLLLNLHYKVFFVSIGGVDSMESFVSWPESRPK